MAHLADSVMADQEAAVRALAVDLAVSVVVMEEAVVLEVEATPSEEVDVMSLAPAD